MNLLKPGITCAVSLILMTSLSLAQPPGRQPGGRGGEERGGERRSTSPEKMVEQMMAYDANKDGKLTKAELTDDRLQRLFTQADADKDGSVTKEEWTTHFSKQPPMGGRGPGGPDGPGGPGGPPGGGRGGPPKPGEILPDFIRDMLKLTEAQTKQLQQLQKEVDAKLDKILTAEQKQELKQMGDRRPRGDEERRGRPPME